jgi:hypothetical protein
MTANVNTHGHTGCVLLCCGLLGCNTLLGNERVQSTSEMRAPVEKQPDSGTAEPDASVEPLKGGRSAAVASDGGEPGRDAATAGEPVGPSERDAGATPAAGSGGQAPAAGSGGSSAPDAPAGIQGTVVDNYRRPVPGAWVWLGVESVQTDADGRFRFASATASYDLTLTVATTNALGTAFREIWRYEGLTRRDPTIQCFSGFSYRSANLQLHVAMPGYPQAGGPLVVAGFASPDYIGSWYLDKRDFVPPLLTWSGPEPTTAGQVHALAYHSDALGVPTAFDAYEVVPAQLGAAATDLTLGLAPSEVPGITLSGRVAGPGERARSDLVVQHFPDGAELAIPMRSGEAFTYRAPALPDSSTTLVLREGGFTPPYASAVIEGFTSDRSDLALEIPRTPQLTAPGDGKSAVDQSTAFRWLLGEPRLAMLIAFNASSTDVLYVVTEDTETQLPLDGSFGYTPPAGTSFSWYVFTRDATSIDDVTADASHSLLASRWTTGHYAASVPRTFVTAE